MEQIKGYVVWRHSINPHTACVFEELGKRYDVIIACTSLEYGTFGGMNLQNVKVNLINSHEDVDDIIRNSTEYIHVNEAVKTSSYWELFHYALCQLVSKGCSVYALYMEQYQWWTKKGLLRRLQWFLLFNFGIGRYIKALGCTGQTGVKAFRKAFIPSRRLFDFIYSVPPPPPNSYMLNINKLQSQQLTEHTAEYNESSEVRFLYVGQIIPRKFILSTVEVFNSLEGNFRFDILGGGSQEKELKERIRDNSKVRYHGKVSLLQVREWMQKADVIILPSVLEGWGCTINEGLMYGCRVLVSDAVGSRALIQNKPQYGKIFKSEDKGDLKVKIQQFIEEGVTAESTRIEISQWAMSIYPEVVANYLDQVISYYEGINTYKPSAPWD